MGMILVQVRCPICCVTLFLIEGAGLFLRVEDDSGASGFPDRLFGSQEHPGTEMLSAGFFSDGDPPHDIFPRGCAGKETACRSGSSFYNTRWDAVSSALSNSS